MIHNGLDKLSDVSGFANNKVVSIREQVIEYRQWQSTPCPHCLYFTNCQELKCAVNPLV